MSDKKNTNEPISIAVRSKYTNLTIILGIVVILFGIVTIIAQVGVIAYLTLAFGLILFLQGFSALFSKFIITEPTLTFKTLWTSKQVNLNQLQSVKATYAGGKSADYNIKLIDNQGGSIKFSATRYNVQVYKVILPLIKRYVAQASIQLNDLTVKLLNSWQA